MEAPFLHRMNNNKGQLWLFISQFRLFLRIAWVKLAIASYKVRIVGYTIAIFFLQVYTS